ncbi:MAG: hypothetical protein ACOVQ6_20050, partial [Brevundimonas sp.]
TVVDAIVIALRGLNALLKGDVSGAFSALWSIVARVFEGILNVIKAIAPEAVAWIRRTVEGIRDWLVNRFQTTVVEPVRRKIEQVKGFFRELYVAVVGNSYIPDMVQGVASWMARLDAGMVQPARNATDQTREAFEDLRADVESIMSSLLSDSERAARELARKLATIRQGVGAGVLTEQEGRRAEAGVLMEGIRPVEGPQPVAQTRIEAPVINLDPMREAAEEFADSFARGMERVFEGDLKGLARDWLRDLAFNAFLEIGQALFRTMNNGGGFNLGNVLGGLSKAIPGFARGGSFTVPGSGTVDSQLVAFRATPGERVDVSTRGQQRDTGRANIAVAVQASPYFDVRVRQVAAPVAGVAYRAAVSDSRRVVPADLSRGQIYSRSK